MLVTCTDMPVGENLSVRREELECTQAIFGTDQCSTATSRQKDVQTAPHMSATWAPSSWSLPVDREETLKTNKVCLPLHLGETWLRPR